MNELTDSALATLLPSVRKVDDLNTTQFLNPGGAPGPVKGATKRVAHLLERYGLDYPISVKIATASKPYPDLEDSYAYSLHIDNAGVVIDAEFEWGALAACSTLFRLSHQGSLPHCHLTDNPVYAWRGLMVDTSRHFISLERLRETIQLMSLYRLNVLHLNLSNDQAVRFSAQSAPRLAAEEHYSSQDLKALVDFGANYGIRIVPELDVPGHTTSWVYAYPEWGAGKLSEPATGFGVHQGCLDPTRSEVRQAVLGVFAELADVFPDSYIHLGGDEVNPKWWNQSDSIQQWMREKGIGSPHDLQTWFINDLASELHRLGKRVIGWDEVLDQNLDDNLIIQAWRGFAAQHHALNAGHQVILSSPYYLDLFLPASYHYAFEPGQTPEEADVAYESVLSDHRLEHVKEGVRSQASFGTFPSLRQREGGSVLGGEACMWSEIVDSDSLHRRVWSRMPAIAERLWNGEKSLSESTMYRRLTASLKQVDEKFGSDLGRAKSKELLCSDLEPLYEQLEPVKWYSRLIGVERMNARVSGQEESHITRPYTVQTPLNRTADHLFPESFHAREVQQLVEEGGDLSPWYDRWERSFDRFEDCRKEFPDQLEELQVHSNRLFQLAQIGRGRQSPDLSLKEPVGEYLLPAAMPILQHALQEIARKWGASGSVRVVKKGYINDTYVVGDDLVLQRLNRDVLNIEAVEMNRGMLDSVIKSFVPPSLRTYDGRSLVTLPDGESWRASRYIPSRNFDVLPTDFCEAAGTAFGKFLDVLSTSGYRPLPAIDGFHDINHYLSELDQEIPHAGEECVELIEQVTKRRQEVPNFIEDDFQVIHGDCKVNNLLFDLEKPEVVSIVDLDTLMWGHPAWDFGDLLRSLLTGVPTDQVDDRIEKMIVGFGGKFKQSTQQPEIYAVAPAHMSFMLAVRFLTDHIRGDTYFKVSRTGENLVRAKEQIELSERLTEKAALIQRLLNAG